MGLKKIGKKISRAGKKLGKGLKSIHKAAKTLHKSLHKLHHKLHKTLAGKLEKALFGKPKAAAQVANQAAAQHLSNPFAACSRGGVQMMTLLAQAAGAGNFVGAMNGVGGGIANLPPAASANILQISAYYHARSLC